MIDLIDKVREPASVAYFLVLVSCRPMRDCVLKERDTCLSSCLHVHPHMHAHTCALIHRNKPQKVKEKCSTMPHNYVQLKIDTGVAKKTAQPLAVYFLLSQRILVLLVVHSHL